MSENISKISVKKSGIYFNSNKYRILKEQEELKKKPKRKQTKKRFSNYGAVYNKRVTRRNRVYNTDSDTRVNRAANSSISQSKRVSTFKHTTTLKRRANQN